MQRLPDRGAPDPELVLQVFFPQYIAGGKVQANDPRPDLFVGLLGHRLGGCYGCHPDLGYHDTGLIYQCDIQSHIPQIVLKGFHT